MIRFVLTSIALGSVVAATASAQGIAASASKNITAVLVHGAFAESSSWDGVVKALQARGYPVVAVANPLRGVSSDAAYVAAVVRRLNRPVILVGHSYGGSVITNVADSNVRALVFVAAFAPDAGESGSALASRFPGSTLGAALAAPVTLADSARDLYIQQEKYPAQFAADVPAAQSKLMAVAQRPIVEAALNEPSGVPAWKGTPSWFVYGSADRNIPAAAHAFMAQRAGSRKTVAVDGASHVVMISHPDAVAGLIDLAATSVLAAR